MQYAIETLVIEQKRLENILRKIEYEEHSEPIKKKLYDDLSEIKKAVELLSPKLGYQRIIQVREMICMYMDISLEEIMRPVKKREIVEPRFLIIWLCVSELNITEKSVAAFFGFDRTTAIHAVKAVNEQLDIKNEIWINRIEFFKNKIKDLKLYPHIVENFIEE